MRKGVDKYYLIAFGLRMKELRKEKKISQEDLMLKAGLSKNQVGLIERGEINTTIDTVRKIAEVLDIPIEELFKFQHKKKKNK